MVIFCCLVCDPSYVYALIASYKDTSHFQSAYTHITFFYQNYFFKHSVSKYNHILSTED